MKPKRQEEKVTPVTVLMFRDYQLPGFIPEQPWSGGSIREDSTKLPALCLTACYTLTDKTDCAKLDVGTLPSPKFHA